MRLQTHGLEAQLEHGLLPSQTGLGPVGAVGAAVGVDVVAASVGPLHQGVQTVAEHPRVALDDRRPCPSKDSMANVSYSLPCNDDLAWDSDTGSGGAGSSNNSGASSGGSNSLTPTAYVPSTALAERSTGSALAETRGRRRRIGLGS